MIVSSLAARAVADRLLTPGVEICYPLYNPTLQKIEVLRLEKRLDEDLRYLRDCPLEYSTFAFDMEPEHAADSGEVPVNPVKVRPRCRLRGGARQPGQGEAVTLYWRGPSLALSCES